MKQNRQAAQEENTLCWYSLHEWIMKDWIKIAQVGNTECNRAEIGGNIWSCLYNVSSPAETQLFELSLRADFFSTKVIQQMRRKHIQKPLYCKLFVMFESFRELIDLLRRREHSTL